MPLATQQPLFNRYYTQTFADVSAPSSVYFAVAARGKIKEFVMTLNSAITGADSIMSFKINGVAGTGAATIANAASGVGVTFTMTPTALNAVNKGDIVELISDGASSTTAIMPATMVVEERSL